tara:strand:+ start:673 stop:1902 length:1230 start_codon:yes stop_codon:yes gene_type:complete
MVIILNKIKINLNKILLFFFIYFLVLQSSSVSNENKEVKVGILLGFTGAVENLTPSMADAGELAFKEVLNNDKIIPSIKFKLYRADTTCNNIKSAKDAAIDLINKGVESIIGAACPDITKEVARDVIIPNKILMISPADNSNELINLKNKKYIFRTTPPKIRGSQILADITKDRGIKKVAISYNKEKDYEIFAKKYGDLLNKNNIKTTILISHNVNINDYSKHISALTAAGGDALAIISNSESGGNQIIKSIVDAGMFNTLILNDEMIDQKTIKIFKEENLRKSFGYVHGLSNIGSNKFFKLAQEAGLDTNNPYLAETYDAAAIVILSNYEKFFSDQTSNKDYVHSVSNKPGIKIYPGDLTKAINLLKEGKLINYEGATNVEFDETGDTNGTFLEVDFKKRKIKSKKIR